jgi:hypothetical protein
MESKYIEYHYKDDVDNPSLEICHFKLTINVKDLLKIYAETKNETHKSIIYSDNESEEEYEKENEKKEE